MMPRSWISIALIAAVALTHLGCGGAEKIGSVPAKGKVLLDGKPLAGASIRFFPEKGPAASGSTNDAGEFVMNTNSENPGVLKGKHQITVEKLGPTDPKDVYAPPKRLIPEKYASIQTSGLSETIGDGGKTDLVLELKSEAN